MWVGAARAPRREAEREAGCDAARYEAAGCEAAVLSAVELRLRGMARSASHCSSAVSCLAWDACSSAMSKISVMLPSAVRSASRNRLIRCAA